MTGNAADADDLVQETFARALENPPSDYRGDRARDLKPWLMRVALNLSRDHLRARKRREYVGPWLPSPIETEGWLDTTRAAMHPEARYSELESVSMAFLIALEALTPSQRSVLLLRDVLGSSVEETAEVLELSASNVKTTHHRARAALESYDQARLPLDSELQTKTRNALNNLLFHLLTGNADAISALLSEDVRALNDGNGEYFAARSPIVGRDKVVLFHLNTRRAQPPIFAVREINGLPAFVCEFPNVEPRIAPRAVFTIELDAHGKIRKLDTVVATGKLTHVSFDFLTATQPIRVSLLARARKLAARFWR